MKRNLLIVAMMLIIAGIKAQNVGIGISVPNSSAALDISSVNKGLLIPRLNTAQRNAIVSPAKGLLTYDSSRNAFWYFNGIAWKEVSGNNYNADSTLVIGQQTGSIASYNLNGNINNYDSSGYLYDSGGPAGGYGNNENYFFTISTSSNQFAVDIQVLSNNLESSNDSLFISDDYNHRYILTGNNIGSFRLFGSAYVQFKSNSTITQSGFAIKWNKIFTGKSNNYDSTQMTGWYFNPAQLYMRGGLNTNNNWGPDSSGRFSFAYGDNAHAGGLYSTAIGNELRAVGVYSIAMGTFSSATGNAATVIGSFNKAVGSNSTAIGTSNTANGAYSNAFGYANRSDGTVATSIGYASSASGYSAMAIGQNAIANGTVSFATGYTDTAQGNYSTAIGSRNKAIGDYSTTIGEANKTAFASYAFGAFNTVNNSFATALGRGNLVNGDGAIAMGFEDTATGTVAVVQGFHSKAGADNTVAIGTDSKALGIQSLAIGISATATGGGAMAMGYGNTAAGNYSATLGYNTKALGTVSMATGTFSTAGGDFSTAMGYSTVASGHNASAFGHFAKASGDYSNAIGNNVVVKSYSGFVTGLFNDSSNAANSTDVNPANRIFEVGNGTADNARSNAVTILQNGNIGIGTVSPVARLDIAGSIAMNDNAIYLRTGSDGNHGLKFDPSVNGPYLFGNAGGALGTNGFPNSLNWDLSGNVRVRSNLTVDNASANSGTFNNVLQLGIGSGEGIASNRVNATAGNNQYGIDFYTASTRRVSISNAGNLGIANTNPSEKLDVTGNAKISGSITGATLAVTGISNFTGAINGSSEALTGNITVQNGKGLIRNTDGTQSKKLSSSVLVNVAFAAGETKAFAVTWPESFTAGNIEAYVGNVTGGAGGWAEVVMTVSAVSTTGAQLYVYNPKTSGVAPNFTVKVIAMGPQ